MSILKKLLSQNRPPAQVIGAAIGAFIGLTLLLFALQTWFDLRHILRGASDGDNYVTVNKPVSLANTIFGKSVFSPTDIETIKQQPFVQSVGAFTANRFKVGASSRMFNFYTELFFESIPSPYLDVADTDFRWHEGQNELPIILSKDYLALYNFGFAISQGLPQFTPSTIRQVTIDITLRGNGREQTVQGRIIGFSERINSVLVPEDFMAFANKNFGDQGDEGTSRLLLKIDNPYDRQLTDFLKEKGYELSSGRLIGGQLGTILNATIAVLASIGVLLMILSIIVFILNYQLIISKSIADIRLLRQIGYHPSSIAKILRGSLLKLLGGVFVAVIIALVAARIGVVTWLEQQGFDCSKNYDFVVWVLGMGLFGFIVFVNVWNIKKQVFNV
ncbi:MAG: hypothetical protein U5L45_18010 [Saprospiraceae bacterium]|nr:hypothetical protein [Saprospiraceae bacterium]